MRKIAYLRNTFLPPSETFIYEQIKYLRKFSPLILTRKYINRDLFPISFVYQIPTRKEFFTYTFFRRSWFFEEVIKKEKPTLIHAHFGPDGVYALPLAKKFKLPLIVTFHGHDITRLPKPTLWPPSWFNYWLFFEELKNSEGVVFHAVSEFIRKKLLEKGFPEKKIIKHYLGIKMPPKPPERKNNFTKTILFAGRLVEKKGVSFLVEAMPQVLARHPEARLLICGDGPLRRGLEKLSQIISVSKSVVFCGWKTRAELLRIMAESDIFVIPSVTARDGDAEGLGMVMLEAMAMGLAVIGSLSGGIPEAISDGENGFLVEEKNSFALAEKINLLLSNRQLALKMGEKARQMVEERFNKDVQSEELEKIYDNLIG